MKAMSAIFGVVSGAALDADGEGTIQQYLRGLLKHFLLVKDATNSLLNQTLYLGNREVILHVNQLLTGSSGGVLQAMAAYIATNPTADSDTFIITDGTTTETWTFKASRSVAFEVAIGLSASATQTNLIAAIVADSTLWSAVATTNLGRFFAATPSAQFVVYRKAISMANDRIYGVQTAATGIKVISFGTYGYSTADATEENIPATDPAAKRFGFGRALTSLTIGEKHRAVEDSLTYVFNKASNSWCFNWDMNDLAIAQWPYPGTSVYLAIGGTSAELAADLPPGKYLMKGTTDFTFIISASGGGGTAVPETAPGIIWNAGDSYYLQLRTAKRIAAITGGATGKIMIVPIATAPVL